MVKLNIVKPPRINLGGKKMGFWKQIGMIVLGTTISLILTLLTAKITDNIQRAKDRRLSAMMVMSNIEKFARNLEEIANYMASNDSTAAWLLSKEVEELEFMPEEVLDNMLGKSFDMLYLTYDKSAENIFTNNMETWKNMGNVKFIDRVGECFSAMNKVEERWNKWVVETEGIMLDIKAEYVQDLLDHSRPGACIAGAVVAVDHRHRSAGRRRDHIDLTVPVELFLGNDHREV